MKKLLCVSLLFAACIFTSNAQINAGPDTVACPGSIVLSAATYSSSSGNSYNITSIPYAPYSFTAGTSVSLSDDAVSAMLNIGFSFSFMGNTYSQFCIGSNGWIAFTPQPASFTLLPLPSADPNIPKNCIMGAFHDLNPGAGGNIYYTTTGTAPNRKLIVSWNQVPLYSCNTPVTQQIVIYEGPGIIENYFLSKPVCTTWSNGNAIQGIQDAAGTTAYTVPGRNCTQWTANSEGWRYSPASPAALGPVTWYNAAGTMIGSGNSINAPVSSSTYFIAQVYDSTAAVTYDDTVYVTIGIPGLSVATTSPACASSMNGTASVTAPGGPYTYQWSTGATTSSISGLAAGNYTVTVTNANGCSETAVAILSSSSQLDVLASHYNVSCASCSDGIVYSSPVGGTPPYTYSWQPGNATTQDLYNVMPGTYTVCVTDAGGCTICESTTISPFGTGIAEAPAAAGFRIDPNPSVNGLVTITFNDLPRDVSVSVINALGSEVHKEILGSNTGLDHHTMNLCKLPKGVYFVRVQGENIQGLKKLVLQ